MTSVLDFTAMLPGGKAKPLAEYAGEVLLIVNVASKCGFTPQYAGLEAMQRDLGPRGFRVLAFPCNQFGGQEPGTDAEIASFCSVNYGTSFPVFSKVDVNGPAADPLWEYLKGAKPGLLGSERIKWNFTKFLVDRTGQVVERYAPTATPRSIRGDVERLLAAS
jgi:glutathione peroxidase